MGIHIGPDPLNAVYIGSDEVQKVYVGSELVWQKASGSAIVGWTSVVSHDPVVHLPPGVQDGDLLIWMGGADASVHGFVDPNTGEEFAGFPYKVAANEPATYYLEPPGDVPDFQVLLALRGVDTDPGSWELGPGGPYPYEGPGSHGAPSIPHPGKVLLCFAIASQLVWRGVEPEPPLVSATSPAGMTEISNLGYQHPISFYSLEGHQVAAVLEDPPNPTGEQMFTFEGAPALEIIAAYSILFPSA